MLLAYLQPAVPEVLRKDAIQILINLTLNERIRVAVRVAGGLPAVVAIINTASAVEKGMQSSFI